jgi:lysozyme family protein
MADSNVAIALTLQHEGGYVNNPNDKGGPTKYGITQADMPGVDIASITPEQATAYYAEHYWKPLYSQISEQVVANKLFDMGVLGGIGTAVKCLQRAMGFPQAAVDGQFGPGTLSYLNEHASSVMDTQTMMTQYRHMLDTHFEAVVATNPQDAEFLKGWENRVAV